MYVFFCSEPRVTQELVTATKQIEKESVQVTRITKEFTDGCANPRTKRVSEVVSMQ